MSLTRRGIEMIVAAAAVVALAVPAAGQPAGPRGPRGHGFARILTQEQMQQVRPWLQAEREAAKPLRDLQKQLRDLVLSEAPDQGKIAALESQIAPLQAEALNRRVALAQRIAATLTPEQRQQLRNGRFVPGFLDPAGGGQMLGPGGRAPRGSGTPPAGR